MYFPGRTGLSAKNRSDICHHYSVKWYRHIFRYNSITRYTDINSDTIRYRSLSTPTSPSIHRRGISSSSASTLSSSTVEDLSEVSLLTAPELSLDPNTLPSDSAATSMGEMDLDQFTYEELISALSPLHHEQEQLSTHQNFGINSDAYTMPSPAREISSGYNDVCNPFQEQFLLGSGLSPGSFDTDILPTANHEGLPTCFTLDSSMDLDMYDYMSSHREDGDQAIQSLHSYLLSIDSLSAYPVSDSMNSSASSTCKNSQALVDALWRSSLFWNREMFSTSQVQAFIRTA